MFSVLFPVPCGKADIRNPLRYLLMNADKHPVYHLALRAPEVGECLSAFKPIPGQSFLRQHRVQHTDVRGYVPCLLLKQVIEQFFKR